jgi:hypothetical protein
MAITAFAEALADRLLVLVAAVLEHIVQQARDRLVLVAAVLEHERGDAEQVVDVGNRRALAVVPGVRGAGVVDGFGEALGQRGHADVLHGRPPDHCRVRPASTRR